MTVCIRSIYQDITYDGIYQKNEKKKQNKKEDWSDKALEYFLETLREQLVKLMNDRRNKWIMFSKRLERNNKKGLMRSRSIKVIKARRSRRSRSCSTRHHAGKKATNRMSKSAKRCHPSSHLCGHRNRYLQIYNQFIGRCKGGVGDAHWGKS